ncbi:MAG: gliding motility-associated C-terminal domain-containing protein [Bacteroidetes bacterium]|nr:gliding motility-associated C-terminal domain-containing protein [Bacteroidota bacterium]
MSLIKRIIYTAAVLLISVSAYATHNRSGTIRYRHLYGTTYEFTVTTCTKSSSEADRPELEIQYGDGSSDTIQRTNIDLITPYDVQINTYIGVHTYTGPSSYIISIEDPNRNAGVVNISNSVDKVFCIQTELIISPFIGTPNNSLVIEDCPCPEFACLSQLYCYNLSAYDPDGDSLSYSLVPCRGEDCLEMSIPAIYNYPDIVGGGNLSIDPITGTLCWDSPAVPGEYNMAIKISEWRNGFYVGAVVQDMQLTVQACDNNAPEIADHADTCVFAGDAVSIEFIATDPDAGDVVTIYATGAVFHLDNNPASFAEESSANSVSGFFVWQPDCDNASNTSYPIIVHAEDNDPGVQLADLSTFRIKVNIPPVTNLVVTPTGNAMTLNWDASGCNGITKYNIYRSLDSTTTPDNCCAAGTPAAMGYVLIGSSTTNSYVDNSELIVGNEYCYLVTAVNASGVESCVSLQDCEHLNFEIPVMTHVSVYETATGTGKDSILWSYPKELNTALYPGPYNYKLYRSDNYGGGTETLILTTPQMPSIVNDDTVFTDVTLNTETIPYTYRVELYSDNLLIGSSMEASSIFITLTPNDNQIGISWIEEIPWANYSYEIYRETPTGSGVFTLIGTTGSMGYTDTGLVNGLQYCYKIKTIGQYTSSGIVNPIINWSQEACASPVDLTAPCAPVATIDGNCDLEETYISWTNPNNSCADDVTRYNLYFAPFSGDSLTLLASFSSDLDTFYVHKDRGSIAGCYYVTALDSVQYNNESVPSNKVCIDNCDGYYELPNVFTPDENSVNDIYHPLLPFKFVDSIDLKIFNRWGDLVFETTDPYINWDGTDRESGKKLNDGVYFYAVTVYEIKLEGLVPRSFQGNIQIINSH